MLSNWQDVTFRYCFEGAYGFALANLLRSRDRPFVFLDIGANQGLYSLIASENCHCAHVYAFEPVPATFAFLEQNISLNKLTQKVTAFQFGISDRNGPSQIAMRPGHSGGASIDLEPKGSQQIEIALRTADTIADVLEPDDLPLLVKVDVEAHEPVVLAQLMNSTLGKRIDTIFYEVDERWVDPATLRQILGEQTFTFTRTGEGFHYDVLAERKNGT